METTTISRYRLIRLLGRGSSGEVYLARDPVFERDIALKVLMRPATMEDAKFEEERLRFNREAKISGRLQHPNIISVYDFGQEGEKLFLAMEFVSGGSLASRMNDSTRPLTILDRIRISMETADAIAHAHERGVLHRDIKPANIMLTHDDHVKVTDFGIGKILHGEVDLTNTGVMVGSPAYMSPEQIKGEKATFQSDIYSFGVVLYQLLTGRKPFPATSLTSLLLQILHEDPPDPLELESSIPEAAAAITMRCLHKDPGARHESARQLAEELKRLVGALEMSAASVGPTIPAHALVDFDDSADLKTIRTGVVLTAKRPAVEIPAPPPPVRSGSGEVPVAPPPTAPAPAAALNPQAVAATGKTVSNFVPPPPAEHPAVRKSSPRPAPPAPLPQSQRGPVTRPPAQVPAWAWVAGGTVAAIMVIAVAIGLFRKPSPVPAPAPVATAVPVAALPTPTFAIPVVETPLPLFPQPSEPLVSAVPAMDPKPDFPPASVRVLSPVEARKGVTFEVSPSDAWIYVGRRFLGTASEWTGPGRGRTLLMPPGTYWLRITYPGKLDIVADVTIDPRADEELHHINVILVQGRPWGPSGRGSAARPDVETQGWVTFTVTPPETKVLVDGKPAGTVAELQSEGLVLSQPGLYQVALANGKKRKSYRVLVSGDAVDKVLDLKADL
ncbi:MAG: protein kinase [Acidobacteria bacterium]|nr:protein kinase [Acidobacteriota bacterium]MCG3194608.1 Serine/threonine-protein kinase PknD [Thermoanaerobaculia bacterium]MCK6684853.1 protein kinase [Thermoanaerobaculia bacterium]